jgi:hypothetical protein
MLYLISGIVEKLTFFSCKNIPFVKYDTGGNEFCTVYAPGIGTRSLCLFNLKGLSFLLIYIYTLDWFLNRCKFSK